MTEKESPFPWDKVQFKANNEIINAALEMKRFAMMVKLTTNETISAFFRRDMDSALKHANFHVEHFEVSCCIAHPSSVCH